MAAVVVSRFRAARLIARVASSWDLSMVFPCGDGADDSPGTLAGARDVQHCQFARKPRQSRATKPVADSSAAATASARWSVEWRRIAAANSGKVSREPQRTR